MEVSDQLHAQLLYPQGKTVVTTGWKAVWTPKPIWMQW